MKIGSLRLANNLLLAPMVRVTDPAFRMVCREQGAALAFTEMLFAQAIVKEAPAILAKTKPLPQDRPLGVQLAGFEPNTLQKAVFNITSRCDLVDLNLGCPVPRAHRQGVGAALLDKPELIGKLVKAMRSATEKPITAKMRILDTVAESVHLARIIEANGADALTVHGRTKQQHHSGAVDFDAVLAIKEAVSIPVINNGGITGRASMLEIQAKTKCDGFMLARSAIGNPGIFAELQGKKAMVPADALKRYLQICNETGFSHRGRIKQQAIRFASVIGNAELSQKLEKVKTKEELFAVIQGL